MKLAGNSGGRNGTGVWWRRHDEYDSCCSG